MNIFHRKAYAEVNCSSKKENPKFEEIHNDNSEVEEMKNFKVPFDYTEEIEEDCENCKFYGKDCYEEPCVECKLNYSSEFVPAYEEEKKEAAWNKVVDDVYECSICGANICAKNIRLCNYCHKCGAKMEKGYK